MNEKNPSTSNVVLAYLIVYFVWGSTFFFIEKALRSFPPFVLGSIRFVIAGTLLMGYCWLKGYKLFNKDDIKQAMFVGFLLLFVDMAAIIWSEQYISSGIVTIISAATAIWFIIFDWRKWKENFTNIPTVIGLILGFTGVVMLFAEQIFSDGNSEQKSENLIAMSVLTLGTIGWTIGSLYSKYSQKKKPEKIVEIAQDKPSEKSEQKKPESLNVMVKTAWQMATAGVTFTLVALFTGEYSSFNYSNVHLADWGAMAYLIIFGSILAFSSYIWLLQMRPATEVSTYAYVNPIVALVLAHFFTTHQVTTLQISGLAVVLFSVLLMNWNLYKNIRTFRAIKHRKKLKRLKNMAPKSSIPRIVEVADFNRKQKKKQLKEEEKSATKL